MQNSTDTIQLIRDFVVDTFLFGEAEDLRDDDSLLEKGVIDSTGVLEIIQFIERDLRLNFNDADIVPENIDGIERLANFVDRLRSNLEVRALS
jgi:acyl carrier protein